MEGAVCVSWGSVVWGDEYKIGDGIFSNFYNKDTGTKTETPGCQRSGY